MSTRNVPPRENPGRRLPAAPSALLPLNGGRMVEIPISRPGGSPDTRTAPVLAFAPLHKRALGMGVGTAAALVVFTITMVHVVTDATGGAPIRLLAEYFYGYTVSLTGAFIGAGWAMLTGFTMGWFGAFSRNLLVATLIFAIRTRAQLMQFRDFLDHV